MLSELASLASLAGGTIALRPYVVAFLAAFLAVASRDIGVRATLGWLAWGVAVAFAAEYASTRVGVPFGLYHYTGDTRGHELFISNVPFFDPLSFPFLAYASFAVVRWVRGTRPGAALVVLSGLFMMLLDVVIDPLAVRGDRWFLGRVFYYAEPGVYWGVPLSNFAGWAVVGWAIVGGGVAVGVGRGAGEDPARGAGLGAALYGAVLLFNLALTAWIGEWSLLAVGILIHIAAFLLLYGAGRGRARQARATPAKAAPVGPDRDFHPRRDEPR